ncbi:MAG TPA: DNA cytosine methyltransferase [Verrucomicrobiae bacterium]|nr:DNA cytosine methyltransferase [Verrucomicrobiae bacterium]
MRTLDIFCGGGLSSAGARAAGAEIVGGIDMWGVATSTFKHNFPKAVVKTARLEDTTLTQLKREVGQIDLLLASPECTNHTCAKGAAPRSETSRATAMQTLRFARAFRPRWVVMENVVHMRPWSRYEELKLELRNIGYHLKEIVLDAADFGVPQRRRRLFVVCDREAEPRLPTVCQNRKCLPASSILDPSGTWVSSSLYSDRRASATLQRAERGLNAVGQETPFLIVYYGSDGSGGWQRLDRPLRTVTTVDRFALIEPSEAGPQMRMLQVPELARAMGVTRRHELPFGSRRDKVQLLGNGVCSPVMKAVVQTLTS